LARDEDADEQEDEAQNWPESWEFRIADSKAVWWQRGRIRQGNVKMTRFVVYHIYRKTGKKRLADYEPGQMQLVFKCGRASEHDAKTSHHHLPGNDTWTWTWTGI